MRFYDLIRLKKPENIRKIRRLKKTILDLLPEEGWGQLPFIVLRQARMRLGDEITWEDMQIAFDQLYRDRRVYPEQDFSETILKRALRYSR